jgi:aldose 1-epimerase
MDDTMVLESASGRLQISVDLIHGGRVSSILFGGHELLVARRDDPIAWGCFPMVPFAGRIRRGVLDFEGTVVTLPQTLGPHAIHGYGLTAPWTRVSDNSIRYEFSEPWPFSGVATQSFVVDDSNLHLQMTVEAGDRQPVSLGWHPWFRREIGAGSEAELIFDAEVMYERDDDGMPSSRRVAPSPRPWDDCFTELAEGPQLRWGTVEVGLASSADHWVVYDEPSHALCVEPQTGPPNDVNDDPQVLDEGESLTIDFALAFRDDA